MDEFEFQYSLAENLLFTFLGGICAIIVGIAIFTPQNFDAKPDRAPSSEGPKTEWVDLMDEMPVLD